MTTRTITLAGYALIAGTMLVMQLTALTTHRLPTLHQALSSVLGRRPGRLLVLAAWLWLGWHVFVRSTPTP
jgi:Family of unknown function (DUF6186)